MSTAATPVSAPSATANGTITVPSFALPLSAALSPQAAETQARALAHSGDIALSNLDLLETEAEYHAAIDAFRAGLDHMFAKPLAERMLGEFPVEIQARQIGGVPVEEFTPAGTLDDTRILINLHGGAFYSGAIHIARVESIPVAYLGRIRVISVDYRQGYEHRYPAATDDVIAVYTELLKTYDAKHIGIYGGSAGGLLTLQVMAAIIDRALPAPAAIGVFGAGAAGRGDGDYFGAIGTGQKPPIDAFSARGTKFGYFGGADRSDRLMNPILGDEAFRAQFPPCLFITGTRAFDLSPAIATHRALCQANVEASLHVFDGMGHCFYYDATLPEGQDAYAAIIRFFNRHLHG